MGRFPLPTCRPIQDRAVDTARGHRLHGIHDSGISWPRSARQPVLGLDPEEAGHLGELAEPAHVDGPDGRSPGSLTGIVRDAALLQITHPLDVRPDRRQAPAGPRGSYPAE